MAHARRPGADEHQSPPPQPDGADDAAISAAIAGIWSVRDDRYSELRTAETAREKKIEMSYIGG